MKKTIKDCFLEETDFILGIACTLGVCVLSVAAAFAVGYGNETSVHAGVLIIYSIIAISVIDMVKDFINEESLENTEEY